MKNRLYNIQVPLVGITGGIASGKSTISQIIRDQGHLVLDADKLIKEIYKLPTTLNWFEKHYPSVSNDNKINFKILREMFFNDEETKKNIENFLHPQLKERFLSKISGKEKIIFYDVPLLFEKRINLLVDASLVVYCEQQEQIRRVCKRDKIDKELALKIISQQMSLEEKKELADYYINNSRQLTDLSSLKTEVLKITNKLSEDLI